MDNYNKQEQDFLEGVWFKARYLEYVKQEQELTEKNAKRLARWRFKLALILSGVVTVIAVPMLVLWGPELGTVLCIGLLLLGAGVYYEQEGNLWK